MKYSKGQLDKYANAKITLTYSTGVFSTRTEEIDLKELLNIINQINAHEHEKKATKQVDTRMEDYMKNQNKKK